MSQPSRDLDLADKPLGAERRGEFGPQHLHGHFAFVLEVLGKVDRGHAARTEFFLDDVAVGKGGFETVEGIRHGAAFRLASPPRWGRRAQVASELGWDLERSDKTVTETVPTTALQRPDLR